MIVGAQLEGPLVLLDGVRQIVGLGIGSAKFRVLVGQLRGIQHRHPAPDLPTRLAGRSERILCLPLLPELGEHDAPVDVRLDVLRVPGQCLVERVERPVRLLHQLIGESDEVVHVREGPALLDQLLEQMDGAVVVLEREPLLGNLKLLCAANVHGSPRTT